MCANSKGMMRNLLFFSIRLNHNNHTSQAFLKLWVKDYASINKSTSRSSKLKIIQTSMRSNILSSSLETSFSVISTDLLVSRTIIQNDSHKRNACLHWDNTSKFEVYPVKKITGLFWKKNYALIYKCLVHDFLSNFYISTPCLNHMMTHS